MDIANIYSIYLQHPSVQTDTRKLKKGDLYFALKGPSFNGNQFAEKAIEQGAAYAIIDDASYEIKDRTILVPDVLTTLQQIAKHHRQQFNIPFIAITGSNGKTTTKELVHAVLSGKYRTYTTEGNLNNHIGVPLTLLKIEKDAEMAVIEMGANHQKEIEGYCRIALPTHGLITNVGKAHLEGFGGEEGVRKGKGELFDHLRATKGTAFVYNDQHWLPQMSKGIPEIFTYGSSEGDVVGKASGSGHFLEVEFSKGIGGKVRTHLVGDYNLPNVLAAVACGTYFNVPESTIVQSIEAYEPTNSRSQLMEKGTNKIILDAYNANPSSMRAAIQNFARNEENSKILVLGAMAELGPESLNEHRAVAEEIARHEWKAVVLVGGDFQKIDHPYHRFANPLEAGAWIREQKFNKSWLLVKGSRSMQMEKILDYI